MQMVLKVQNRKTSLILSSKYKNIIIQLLVIVLMDIIFHAEENLDEQLDDEWVQGLLLDG